MGIHHLAATARATAYRTAKQSEVFCDLCGMLDVAANSDDAIVQPRQAEWRMSSPVNFPREIVNEVEVVPGTTYWTRRVVEILCGLEGGVNWLRF